MIDFIKKNKSLTAIFEEVETMHEAKSSDVKRRQIAIEEVSIPAPPKMKPFYTLMCEDFVARLSECDMKYDESLVRINIAFKNDNPSYKVSFPLIETGETSVKIFVSCLKESIKKFISEKYEVNLFMKETEDTYNVVVVLDELLEDSKHKNRSIELEGEA